MSNLATIAGLEGDRYSALLRHPKLAALILESGDTSNYGTVMGNIGSDYAALNRDDDAIPYLQKAVLAFRTVHDGSRTAIYLGQLCLAALRQRRLNDALSDCQQAHGITGQINDPKRLAIATWRLGKVLQAMGRTPLAIEDYNRAVSLSEQVPDPRTESQVLLDLGDAYNASSRREEALPLFKQALALSQRAEDSAVQLDAHYRIAGWYAASGQSRDALHNATDELKIALGAIETQRRSVHNGDLQASYLTAERKCHELYVDILMREHERRPTSSSEVLPPDVLTPEVLALEIAESARARNLLDAIALRGTEPPAHQDAVSGISAGPTAASAARLELRAAVQQGYDRMLKLLLEGAPA